MFNIRDLNDMPILVSVICVFDFFALYYRVFYLQIFRIWRVRRMPKYVA